MLYDNGNTLGNTSYSEQKPAHEVKSNFDEKVFTAKIKAMDQPGIATRRFILSLIYCIVVGVIIWLVLWGV